MQDQLLLRHPGTPQVFMADSAKCVVSGDMSVKKRLQPSSSDESSVGLAAWHFKLLVMVANAQLSAMQRWSGIGVLLGRLLELQCLLEEAHPALKRLKISGALQVGYTTAQGPSVRSRFQHLITVCP